jgi:hypothetical protein
MERHIDQFIHTALAAQNWVHWVHLWTNCAKENWEWKNGEYETGLCKPPEVECLRYSQQLFLSNPQMVSDPIQKHCIVSTRYSRQYTHVNLQFLVSVDFRIAQSFSHVHEI